MRRRLVEYLFFVLLAAVTGIIGNRADFLFINVTPFMATKFCLELWTLITVPAILTIPFAFSLSRSKAAHNLASKLNQIDADILRFLPILAREPQDLASVSQAVDLVMQKVINSLQKFSKCGIAIYCPNQQEPYLTTWKTYSNPNEGADYITFYIGNEATQKTPTSARGIAGQSFINSATLVAHIEENGRSDNPHYLLSPSGRVDYRSLICVPLIGSNNEKLGVLCFYSSERGTFDQKGTQKIIEGIGYRLSMLLSVSMTC